MRFKGKVALITGAANGIGAEIAEVLAEREATVLCADRDVEQGNALAKSINDKQREAFFYSCDISQEQEIAAMTDKIVERFGHIDILVNNAGINFVSPFHEMTVEEWDRVLEIDLRGSFLCTRACIEHFLKQEAGCVVNIASVHTLACLPGAGPYDAAKWGVVGLTKSLAVEYASRGIRFNCLSPGLIDTQIWTDIQESADDLTACHKHWQANIPMGRVGTVREIGQAVAFLASDDASYITGANLVVDGGMSSQLISRDIC